MKIQFPTTVIAALTLLVSSTTAAANTHHDGSSNHHKLNHMEGFIRKADIPNTGRESTTLANGIEFQPALDESSNDPKITAAIRQAQGRMLEKKEQKQSSEFGAYEKQFIDGTETYYDEYSQAWRLLGFYIDCNYVDQDNNNNNNNNEGGASCTRMLLWAAYVDLEYQGDGTAEYQYWDRFEQVWNDEPCKYSENQRCAKMDCHLSDTHFSLLGYFKEPESREWMEQLFKHEGVCVWTDDEYSLMQYDREAWPEYCTQTGSTDENGNSLYLDEKPLPGGGITLGLYTDSLCIVDYEGDVDIQNVLDNYNGGNGNNNNDNNRGNAASLEKTMEEWNKAFQIFNICQPCVAYDLNYISGSGNNNHRRRIAQDDDDNQVFHCHDDAGYDNVNQCMKFRTKTKMLTATFQDVILAARQGTIADVHLMGSQTVYSQYKEEGSWGFLGFSSVFLVAGCWYFFRTKKNIEESSLEEPLVASNEGTLI